MSPRETNSGFKDTLCAMILALNKTSHTLVIHLETETDNVDKL